MENFNVRAIWYSDQFLDFRVEILRNGPKIPVFDEFEQPKHEIE